MKKYITVLMSLLILSNPIVSIASQPIGYSGGVYNEFQYEEIVFISGEPIKFVGEVEVDEDEDKEEGIKTLEYEFELLPEDRGIEGELNREVSLIIQYEDRNDKGQIISTTILDDYDEEITIENMEYELYDYQLSHSDVIDNRPASDFYSGNIIGRKYYTINEDMGEVIVDINGGSVGYENFWGNTDTQVIDYTIQSKMFGSDDNRWLGSIKANISDSVTKELRYSDNQATLSSFNGGYIKVTNREVVSSYYYDLPKISKGNISNNKRIKDDIKLSNDMNPKIERLIVPKFRDLNGHWAESYIEKLYSLDIFEEHSRFFSPDIPITRKEFTKAVMRASDIRVEEKEEDNRRRRDEIKEESSFIDISTEDDDYKYLKSAYKKGIIKGVPPFLFHPERPLTRSEAITILIRALGFENRAPNPGYITSFTDDRDIPVWARDSIYVANEIGLITGDGNNKVLPNKKMTRAEASTMIVRFLEFLENDLQKDYRERVMLFN